MPSLQESFRARDWNQNLNLITYFSLILTGIGVAWLALNEVPSGIRYITIFLVAVAIMVLSFFFIREDQKETLSSLIRIPFETDIDIGATLYILGWIVAIILALTLPRITGFSATSFMIPLSAGSINKEIAQSFTVAETQADPFWQWFISVFTAGTIEEFAFGFVLVLAGAISGMLIWRLLFPNASGTSNIAKNFYLVFGILVSVALFVGAHQLNSTYVGIMFIIAGIFRLAMNWLIYGTGVFISFTIGYHQSNNAVWFFTTYGANATIKALTSTGGLIILAFFLLLIFFLLRRFDTIWNKTKKVFRTV